MTVTLEKTRREVIDQDLAVSDPQDYILHSTESLNLFMAGVGSGKTHTMGLLAAEYIINFPHMLGFIGANTHEQLNKSTLKRIFEVWFDCFGWINGVHYVCDVIPPPYFKKRHIRLKEYHNTITFNNGCMIFVGSLDNYKAIDGQEFGWAMLDETKDTKKEALEETITWRLRQTGMYVDQYGVLHTQKYPGLQMKGFNPLYIFTSPAKEQWLNEMFDLQHHYDEIEEVIYRPGDFFRMKKGGKCVSISSTWHNARNLPPGFIERQIELYKGNKHLVATMIYGSPIAKIGAEFYHQFVRSVHVHHSFTYRSGAVFHISSDQNAIPYFTIIVAQIFWSEIYPDDYPVEELRGKPRNKWVVRFVREYCLPNPRNNMEDACKTFLAEYEDRLNDGLFFYGDPGGNNESSLTAAIKHHYQVLESILKKFLNDNSNRVPTAYPGVIKRRDFINKILAGGYAIDVEIHPDCEELIADLDFTKEDRDGKKNKELTKDKTTQRSYEKRGHCTDAMDYMLTGAFEDLFNEFE